MALVEGNDMKAYIVGDISVHDLERYKTYVEKAPHFVAKHQGTYLVRGGDVTAMEGDWNPKRMVVLEFPSKEHALAFAQDPDYLAIAVDRQEATTSKLIIVEGAATTP
jgi:uncharacterized protein (DUF1330 family)